MGREAEAHGRWDGQEGWTKAILESGEIILRGDIRARLPRAVLSDWRVEGDVLVLRASGALLELGLGATEAARWVAALDKPLPTLAQKLGLGAASRGYLLGEGRIVELDLALSGATADRLDQASMIIAILRQQDDLQTALHFAKGHLDLPIWCVHGKGKAAKVTDSHLRNVMRAAGYMDVKASAVAEDWTATRYLRR